MDRVVPRPCWTAHRHSAAFQTWDRGSPLFVAGAVNAWSWTPSDVAGLGELLGDPFGIVRRDVFFDLLNRVGSREKPGPPGGPAYAAS
ncbi:hypothetical protein ABZS88_09535 [Streptomyces sp. NPDC005480]|uniref:hypothetical protein n=1 Tax=Streptomyces sp. NPDC005480 TaxID=3154880 RepID=UPI0033AE3BB7